MAELRHDATHGPEDLTLKALLYWEDELPEVEAEEVQKHLATDQAAQQALANAVELAHALAGRTSPRPDPAYRRRVRERLARTVPKKSGRWWHLLAGKRAYRGHPLVWAV